MASLPMSPVGGNVMRVTKLGSCGEILTGVGSCMIVSSGFISIERTSEIEEPTEVAQLNANGELCPGAYRTKAQLKWLSFNITFCRVDPALYSLVTGSALVLDDAAPTPNEVGFRTRGGPTGVGSTNFGLEIWANLIGETCVATANTPYGYYLAPWLSGGMPGDVTWENGAVNFSMQNAVTRLGSPWGTGHASYLVRRDAATSTLEPLLTAITSLDHDHMERVTAPPPAVTTGCTVLAP